MMSSQEWKKVNMKPYSMRIAVSTGIPAAIRKASEKMGIAETAFVRAAVEEKLIRDGYWKKSEE